MILMLYGADTYSRDAALARKKAALDQDGMLSTNTTSFEAGRVTAEEVLAACDTVPFLAGARLVVVDGLLAGFETREDTRPGAPRPPTRRISAEEQSKWLALAAYAERMPPTTTLALIDDEVSASNALLKALRGIKDKVEITEFPSPRGQAINEWIMRVSAERGVAFDPGAAAALASFVGPNTVMLATEIEKLGTFANGRKVTADDVRQLSPHSREANVFTMVDAVVEGRLDVALRLLRELLAGGATPPYVMAMLVRQYRNLILARDLLSKGTPPFDIGRQLGINAEYAIRKVVDQANRYSAAALERAYRRLLAADVAVKRGEVDEEPALELLVAELCRPAA
jgi:DNA polymerase-3 subunit delta